MSSFSSRGALASRLLSLLDDERVHVLDIPSPVARALWFFIDARRDPFFPASPLVAAWFVARHWRWLHSASGPYAS